MTGPAAVATGLRTDGARLFVAWDGPAARACATAVSQIATLADELAEVMAYGRRVLALADVLTTAYDLARIAEQARRCGDRLDGIARSLGNERSLLLDLHVLERKAVASPLSISEGRRLLSARAVQEQMDRVRTIGDPARPRTAQLLAYDATFGDDDGRTVVAVGDVAAADNVAFVVPGLGADVGEDIDDLVHDALNVSRAAESAAPEQTTAAIAWLGYDAPDLTRVAFSTAAIAGGALLAGDLRMLARSRSAPARVTVIGHSYGSVTAAEAARTRAPMKNLVLTGSPGVRATHASQLLPAGRVYVAAHAKDVIAKLAWFGPDPAKPVFGAVRVPAGTPDDSRDVHDRYLEPGSESLRAIGDVVAGRR